MKKRQCGSSHFRCCWHRSIGTTRRLVVVALFAALAAVGCSGNSAVGPTPTPTSTQTPAPPVQQQGEWDFVFFDPGGGLGVAHQTSCTLSSSGDGFCGRVFWSVLRTATFGCTARVSFIPLF